MEWISVKDIYPKKKQHVLCIDENKKMFVAEYQPEWNKYQKGFEHGYCCGREPMETTHWMPLPEPPDLEMIEDPVIP